MVRRRMMLVVLRRPPRIAHADEQVADDESKRRDQARVVGDLPMGQVMAEESHVREDKPEQDGRGEDDGRVIEHEHDGDGDHE